MSIEAREKLGLPSEEEQIKLIDPVVDKKYGFVRDEMNSEKFAGIL